MSHVDDGTLHAYLDGALPVGEAPRGEVEAHLRACADCRVRLEAAERDREGAGEILGLLAPEEIQTPPFDELMARRAARGAPGASGPGRGRWQMSPAHLAWAASLLVALGGGWTARAALFPSAAPDAAADRPAAEMAAEEAAVEGSGDPPLAQAPGDPTVPEAPPTEVALDTVPDPAEAVEAAPDPPPAQMAAEPQAAPAPAAGARAEGELREVAELEVASPRLGEDVAAALFAAEARATAQEAWTPVSPAEAARFLGHPPLELEELPWERMEAAEVDGGSLIRSVHPRPDGTEVELVQAGEGLLVGAPPRPLALSELVVTGTPPADAARITAARAREDLPPPVADRAAAPEELRLALGSTARDGLVAAIRGPGDREALEALLRRLR